MHKYLLIIIISYLSFTLLYFLFYKYLRLIFGNIEQRNYLAHQGNKKYIPVIGGLLIFCSIIPYIYNHILFLSLILYGLIGFIDDLLKQKRQYVNFYYKMLFQLLSFLIIIYCCHTKIIDNEINLIICKLHPPIYIKYIFSYFVIVGMSNGVNISDGLDGLSGKNILNLTSVLAVIAYIQGQNHIFTILCSLIGAVLGFLTFNNYPAKIFIGDMGSLGIGAMLGLTSIILNCEFILIISGIYFLIASLSIMIQILYYRLYGRRFFLIAPIHHTFERMQYHESFIVESINIMSILFSILALIIYLMS